MIFKTALIILLALNCHIGSSIRIETTREYNDDGIQTKLGIRCLVEEGDTLHQRTKALKLVKDDRQTIMTAFSDGRVEMSEHHEPEVTMESNFDLFDESNTYLHVKYDPVYKSFSGKYSCARRWKDYGGKFHEDYTHKRINVNDEPADDVIQFLIAKVSKLENYVDQQIAQVERRQDQRKTSVYARINLMTKELLRQRQHIQDLFRRIGLDDIELDPPSE